MSLQAQYSLLCRQTGEGLRGRGQPDSTASAGRHPPPPRAEYELSDVCVGEGVGLLAWSPLKGGWLSGKVQRTRPCAPA